MKKLWWLLPVALLAAGSLLFMGCPDGGGGSKELSPAFYVSLASEEDPLVITLGNNFEYGDGYQGLLGKEDASLMKGNKVNKGDLFFLDIEFTVDRDLEDALFVGLVDTVTNYWDPLTWAGDPDDPELVTLEEKDEEYTIKATDEVSTFIEMTALKRSPSKTLAQNVMVFQTVGEPKSAPNPDHEGVKGPVKLTFTKFVFARDNDGFDVSKVPGFEPPPPPPELEITVDGTAYKTTEYRAHGGTMEIDANGKGFTYTTEGFNYQGNYVTFKVDLGTGKTLGDFEKVTFTFEGVDGDVEYKNLALWAEADAITGDKWTTAKEVGKMTTQYSNGEKDVEIPIGGDGDAQDDQIAELDSNIIYVAIYVGGGSTPAKAAEFTVKDIEFVKN